MKTDGVNRAQAKPPAPTAEKPKHEKSAFDKLLRNKSEDVPCRPGFQPAEFAPVMKSDETPGPASSRLLDRLGAEITAALCTKDIKEVQIQFDSKTLAGLQVSIRSEQGKLLVKMQASNSEVANLLERNSTDLVERLAEKGYAGAEVRVARPARLTPTPAKPFAPTPLPAFKRGPR